MTAVLIKVKFRLVPGRLECVVELNDLGTGEIIILRHLHEEGRYVFRDRRHARKIVAVDWSGEIWTSAHIGLDGGILRDHSASRESHEDNAIRRDAPLGGMGAHDPNGLNTIVQSVLSILGDQGVIADLGPEARSAGLAYLSFVLSLDLRRSVFQVKCRNASSCQPLCDIFVWSLKKKTSSGRMITAVPVALDGSGR